MGLFVHHHNWSNWERNFSTCEYVRHCKDSNCQTKDLKMDHNWGEWKYETSHSCHFIRKCYRCGEIDSGEYKHNWSEWHYESEKSCKAETKCLRCGKIQKGKKYHHIWNNWHYSDDKNCKAFRICSRCGQSESDLAHPWGNWEYKSESDCGQIRHCKQCGSKEIGLEKHKLEKVGFLKWTCKRCNMKKKIKTHIIPNWWHSKRGKGINANSQKFKSKESHRIEIIEDLIKGEDLERQRKQEKIELERIQEQERIAFGSQREQKKIELERKEEQERINSLSSISKVFKKSMTFFRKNLFLDCLIIDSNIWMDDRPQYDNFISVFRFLLKSFNIRYIFYGPQFDEICNKKKRTGYGESANRRSRTAIKRIDKLSDENLLEITQINFESKYPGHVDPLLIKLLLIAAKKGKSVTLLSNDVELRIRAREKLKEHNVDDYKILKMDDLEKHINTIQLAMKEGIADNVEHRAENVIYL
ncbi:hypothetical protein N9219_02240 [bacterium]|nr:hypothetical protein [bacterium]